MRTLRIERALATRAHSAASRRLARTSTPLHTMHVLNVYTCAPSFGVVHSIYSAAASRVPPPRSPTPHPTEDYLKLPIICNKRVSPHFSNNEKHCNEQEKSYENGPDEAGNNVRAVC